MPVMLMSNPGLHLAALGNPPSTKGSTVARKKKRYPKLYGSRRAYRRTLNTAANLVGMPLRTSGHINGALKVTHAAVAKGRKFARKKLYGLPWSGRAKTIRARGVVLHGWGPFAKGDHVSFTNPKRRSARRRNPMNLMKPVKGYVASLPKIPTEIMSAFKGKGMVKNLAFAAGGAAATSVAGAMVVGSVVAPVLNMIPGGAAVMESGLGARVVNGLAPYTLGYVGSRFLKGDMGRGLLVGGAIASVLELLMPGKVRSLISQGLSTVGLPGLGAYVDAAAYQGTGAYVDAAAYQGTGAYVDAAAYQGTGNLDYQMAGLPAMAGNADYQMAGTPAMAGYLDNGSYLDRQYLS